MISFVLRPYVGADPITFDMQPVDDQHLLGIHDEVSFVPGTLLFFEDLSLFVFEEQDLLTFLMAFDTEYRIQ